MMAKDPLQPLLDLALVAHEQAQHRIHDIVAEEQQLRTALDRLAGMAQAPHSPAQRTIGADILWRRWISQQTAEINMRLARVLARKEHHMAARQTFGRLSVLEELTAENRRKAQKRAAAKELEEIVALQITRAPGGIQ